MLMTVVPPVSTFSRPRDLDPADEAHREAQRERQPVEQLAAEEQVRELGRRSKKRAEGEISSCCLLRPTKKSCSTCFSPRKMSWPSTIGLKRAACARVPAKHVSQQADNIIMAGDGVRADGA